MPPPFSKKVLTRIKICCILFKHADMAQLVEQLIRNQQVVGSSPTISSKKRVFCFSKDAFFVFVPAGHNIVARQRTPFDRLRSTSFFALKLRRVIAGLE